MVSHEQINYAICTVVMLRILVTGKPVDEEGYELELSSGSMDDTEESFLRIVSANKYK